MIIDFSKYDCAENFSIIVTPHIDRKIVLKGAELVLGSDVGTKVVWFRKEPEAMEVFTLLNLGMSYSQEHLEKHYPEYFI